MQESLSLPIMTILYQASKKEESEKKGNWHNQLNSLGIEPRRQNELNDKKQATKYNFNAYTGLADQIQKALAPFLALDTNVAAFADAIVTIVDMPFGKRPIRVRIDLAQEGSEIGKAVADGIRTEFLRRIGLSDLLTPRVND
jgi:hypothetical protein